MSVPVEEILSQYLDALHAGTAPPVPDFLAGFPDLSPTTTAGLARVLETMRRTLPADAATLTRQRSWQQLESLLAGESRPASIAPAPAEPPAPVRLASPPPPPVSADSGKLPPAPVRPAFPWPIPVAAAVLLIAVVALVLGLPQIRKAAAPLTGPRPLAGTAGVGGASLPATSTLPPAPVALAGPIATVTAGPYVVAVDVLAADGSIIVLGLRIVGEESAPEAGGAVTLRSADGRALLSTGMGSGVSWHPPGHADQIVRGTEYAFDASSLAATSPTLDLRLTMDLTVGPPSYDGPPEGGVPRSLPTTGPAPVMGPVAFDQVVHLPFDPRRRIAEPNLTVTGRGVALTLERVVVTASEARFYLRGSIPPGVALELRGDTWAGAPGSSIGMLALSGSSNPQTGEYVYRLGLNLIDAPSPWILTLPAVTTDGTGGIATPDGPHTWAGPWVFYFAMPDATASLTPGPLPTLPPATAVPTDLPGAVPTYAGPLSGPVPPTSTTAALALTPTLPAPPSDCAHPAPLFLALGDGGQGQPAIATTTPPSDPFTATYAKDDVTQYLQAHSLQGTNQVAIQADPNSVIQNVELMTLRDIEVAYGLRSSPTLNEDMPVYRALLRGRFVFSLNSGGSATVPSPTCGLPPGVLGIYTEAVAVFDAQTGKLLLEGGVEEPLTNAPAAVPAGDRPLPTTSGAPTSEPITPTRAAPASSLTPSALAAIRQKVAFPVFVPVALPPDVTPEPPAGGDSPQALVQITYHTGDGAVALRVTDGPSGCCLAADGRKAGEAVTLANGIAAHYLPGTPASGGPILWWQQEGAYIALSGPQLAKDDLARIAASVSKTADLGPLGAVPARPSPSPIPTPAFAILRPAWLPAPLTLREEYAQAAGQNGPVSYAILHFDAASGANGQDALLLIEQPQMIAANPATAEPDGVRETIGGHDVTIGYRGSACMNLAWVEGGIALTLVNSYDPPGQPRYSCDQLRQVVESVP